MNTQQNRVKPVIMFPGQNFWFTNAPNGIFTKYQQKYQWDYKIWLLKSTWNESILVGCVLPTSATTTRSQYQCEVDMSGEVVSMSRGRRQVCPQGVGMSRRWVCLGMYVQGGGGYVQGMGIHPFPQKGSGIRENHPPPPPPKGPMTRDTQPPPLEGRLD